MVDKDTMRSRGFGFVEFKELAAYEAALKETGSLEIAGRKVCGPRVTAPYIRNNAIVEDML